MDEIVAASNRPATTVRLFLALWPDRAASDELTRLGDAWALPDAVSRVARENLHLTLHFLGAVPLVRLAELRDALHVSFAPFDFALGRPALWSGGLAVLETESPPPLVALHAALADRLRDLPLPIDPRPFRPHVTLARGVPKATPLPENGSVAVAVAPWHVQGYALAESRARPAIAYRVLQRYPLCDMT